MTDIDRPAFPVDNWDTMPWAPGTPADFGTGLTIRQHAALTLRIPDSGDPTLDAMIRQAVRRDLAAQALATFAAAPHGAENTKYYAMTACALADALLDELERTR